MKINISEKTLHDLEFTTVLEQVSKFCISELGRKKIKNIKPFLNKEKLFFELKLVNEYLSSFENENKIPNHQFDDITKHIERLSIENSFLEIKGFLKLASVSETVNQQKKFLQKFKIYYPNILSLSDNIEFTTFITDSIGKIILPYGEIKNSASSDLKILRKNISIIKEKINDSFSKALNKNLLHGFLDDIKETIVNNQPVLAVKSMYRKKINGSLLGTSKSGNIVYIAPESTLLHTRELQNLIYEEKQEVIKILRKLTQEIRPLTSLFKKYLFFLTHLDYIGAKAKYAKEINALLPNISNEKELFFKKAIHPILWIKNKSDNLKTISQTIKLNSKQQIIVISGPNAGGKSLTLKTIGLLQLMLQSGLLIPVDENSKTYIFNNILTDIGDNQSIENQLSTYSYRLKNMRYFLNKCDNNTLFLIDEFGTGSDPELGGALAEIFLEEFYDKKAFGIITTHYANLKILANELENVSNANMEFNERTLKPLYKLFIGQAGSSFTFEVAQKNGIPYRLINRAKKRVETEKIRLDKTISKLQKERNKLKKTSNSLEKQKNKGQEHIEKLQEKEKKIHEKLEGFQTLYDNNQRMLSLGRKSNEILNKYFQTNNKKELTSTFLKWVSIEKTKYFKKNTPIKKSKKEKRKELKIIQEKKNSIIKVEKEVLKKVISVRKQNKIKKKAEKKSKANYVFKTGDSVRLINGKSIGIINKIEKKNVFITYDLFTTKAKINQLELVEKKHKNL